LATNSEEKSEFKQSEAGLIPEKWQVAQLRDLCVDISYGYTASAAKERVGPKFLRITDIVPYFIDWRTVPFCKISNNNRVKYRLDMGDIVIARTGANTGANAAIRFQNDAVFASYLIRFKIDPEKADPFFVGYVLKSDLWRSFVNGIVSGSAQPGANAKQLGTFSLPLPPLVEQKSIAKILLDMDSKIELDLHLNKTLEDVGKEIFKRWFVDFEFPNEEGKPYKSSGGEMVDGYEFAKEVPRGWKVVAITEVAKIVDCLHSKKPNRSETGPILLQVFNIGQNGILDLSECYNVSEEDYTFWTRNIEVKGGDCVITNAGRVGAVAQIPEGFRFGIGRNMTAIRPVDIPPTYLIDSLLSKYGVSEIRKNVDAGTILDSLNVKGIVKIRILLPPRHILDSYEESARPLRKSIEMNVIQTHTLSQIRDRLLPKLMSGRIRVPAAKESGEA
jgi:type I restriction enzyme S subunit